MAIKPPKIRRISASYQERISFRAVCEALSIRIEGDDSEAMKYACFKENECVYCGDKVKLTWDHLIPITPRAPKNKSVVEIEDIGHSVYGNLVRACSSCNSSKGNRDFEEWMLSDSKKSPKIKQGEEFAEERLEILKKYREQEGSNCEFQDTKKKLKKLLKTDNLRKEILDIRKNLEKKIKCLEKKTEDIINVKKD